MKIFLVFASFGSEQDKDPCAFTDKQRALDCMTELKNAGYDCVSCSTVDLDVCPTHCPGSSFVETF